MCVCLCAYVLCLDYYVFSLFLLQAAHVANKVVYIIAVKHDSELIRHTVILHMIEHYLAYC